MWRMLQSESPDDYVCATGTAYSIRDLCSYVFSKLGMTYEQHIIVEPKYMRPFELQNLKGDSTKLRGRLSWHPTYTFESMLDEMIDYWSGRLL